METAYFFMDSDALASFSNTLGPKVAPEKNNEFNPRMEFYLCLISEKYAPDCPVLTQATLPLYQLIHKLP